LGLSKNGLHPKNTSSVGQMMEQQQVSKRQAGLIRLRQCGKCQQGKLKAAAESHVSFNHHLVSGYWTACEPEHHHILLMGFNRMKVNGKDYPIYYGNIENAPKYQPENIFFWGGNSTSLKPQTSQVPGFLTATSPIFGPPAVILFIIDLQTRPCTEDTGSLWGSETSIGMCL